MLESLARALSSAHSALEYLVADPDYAQLGEWDRVYQTHLVVLYDLLGSVSDSRRDGGVTRVSMPIPRLLVVTGPIMRIDLSQLRGAQRKYSGQFTWGRLVDPSGEDFSREMTRARRLGRPITWVHLGVHGNPGGVELGGKLYDGEWLSSQLSDVDVLLLAACDSDSVADWLSVVPWVVSFAEEIANEDASMFAGAFWGALAGGHSPDEAVDAGLTACSPEVSEYVRRHW